MQNTHYISDAHLSLDQVWEILRKGKRVALSDGAVRLIRESRAFLEQKLKNPEEVFYGINTGFGALCNVKISPEQIKDLQHHLLLSHACGVGKEAPEEIVRLMLLLKIQSLCYGYSGVREQLIQRLVYFFNEEILPVVHTLGSLGASGDLAPLAHLSLPLIGEGAVMDKGSRSTGAEALVRRGIRPLELEAKEGIALLNGTQFSSAYAVWCSIHGWRLMKLANLCAALSLDAFHASLGPFHPALQAIRPHKGQIQAAEAVRYWLEDSAIMASEKPYVQDPYAFRCVPQVHGASWGVLQHVEDVVLTEINSVTDNPNIFPKEGFILSGGNFHGQPLALALDYLAMALSELGSISERRTYQLISGKRGLPDFLTPDPGLYSGLMIPQYTAASIASQNKQLCTPASVDSIVSSNLQEDHVSMSANAGTKAYQVVENVQYILAIEWMTAAQALEFRRPANTSPRLESLLKAYRERVPRLEEDRYLHADIEETHQFLTDLDL